MSERSAKLTAKYGNGKPADADELYAFQLAFGAAGLGAVESCALAAWMGGAAAGDPRSDWGRRFTTKQTANAAESCDSPISPEAALAMLRSVDSDLAELVTVKAMSKLVAVDRNIRDNAVQELGPFGWTVDVSDGIVNSDVIAGLTDTLSGAGWLARNLKWILVGAAVIAVVVGGVVVLVKVKNGSDVLKSLGKAVT